PARDRARKRAQASDQGGALMPVPVDIRTDPRVKMRTPPSRASLKLQVLTFTAVVVVGLVGILYVFFHLQAQELLQNQLEQRVRGLARNLANASLYGVITGDTNLLDPELANVRNEEDVLAASVIDKNGKVLAATDRQDVGSQRADDMTQ